MARLDTSELKRRFTPRYDYSTYSSNGSFYVPRTIETVMQRYVGEVNNEITREAIRQDVDAFNYRENVTNPNVGYYATVSPNGDMEIRYDNGMASNWSRTTSTSDYWYSSYWNWL